jgi:hypothetical protein
MFREKHGRSMKFLSDILLLSACCLFIISVFQPFLVGYSGIFVSGQKPPQPVIYPPTYHYWSFQEQDFRFGTNKTYAFSRYWFVHDQKLLAQFTQAPKLLLDMFVVQILTIALGLLSLSFRKEWMALIPFVSSAIVILLMVSVYNELARWFSQRDYEMGYWLVFPSMLLFLVAFITILLAGKTRTGGRRDD